MECVCIFHGLFYASKWKRTIIQYYFINEELARRAKEMNSYFDYKAGSATAEYRQSVDEAAQIAETQKRKVDPIHRIVAKSAKLPCSSFSLRKRSTGLRRESSVFSQPVTQRSGCGLKRRSSEMSKPRCKQRGEGYGACDDAVGISADDHDAVQKLKVKLEGLERAQESMKAVNAYYRNHKKVTAPL